MSIAHLYPLPRALPKISQNVFPQHEPGPAHDASDGRFPQQVVSPGPGKVGDDLPVMLLVADMSFRVSVLPHDGHASGPSALNAITSPE